MEEGQIRFTASTRRAAPQAAPVGLSLHGSLRERILRNELSPGARMSEAEVAAAYAVSRQPVREAFIKLAEEGLIEVRPQRGTFVRKISIPAVMDARFVREAIEADIVRLLALDPDPRLAAELAGQFAEQQRAAEAGDAGRFIRLDELFHRTLAEAAGKERAWSFVEGLKVQMDRVRFLSLIRFPMDKLTGQHRAIAAGIAAGDPAAAEAALRGHLREILNDLPAIAAEHPELFEGPE